MRLSNRRRGIIIFTLLLVSVLALFGASCGEHEHSYKKEVLAEATCETDGVIVYKCSCGEYYVENISRLGHDMVPHQAGEEGCTKWKAYEACSRCSKTTQVIESNHSFQTHPAQTADCYHVGWNSYSECIKCGLSTKKEIPVKHGTMIFVDKLDPTCENDGHSAYHYCELCGQSNDKDILPALGHDLLEHLEREATCFSIGREAYVSCRRDGCTYSTYKEIAEVKHDLVHHDAKKATCTEYGWEAYDECKNCSYSTYVEIPALGHDFDSGICKRCSSEEPTVTILKDRVTEYKLLYDGKEKELKSVVEWVNSELKKTVGWEFAIKTTVPTTYNGNNKYIVFGNNAYTANGGFRYDSVQGTDYKIIVDGNNVMVLGSPLSIKYGVYGFLNSIIGYEKFNIKEGNLGEQIYFENKDDIILTKSQIEQTHIKDIAYAQGFSSGNIYSNALGASEQNLASMGFTYGAVLFHGCSYNDDGKDASLKYNVRSEHNSLGYYPTAVYLKAHPEWYAHDLKGKLIVNTKTGLPEQVCYYELAHSGEAIQRAVTVFEYHKLKSGWDSLSISNMDTGGHCSCSHCKDNLAYQYVYYLNKLAEALAKNDVTKDMEVQGMIYSNNCLDVPLDDDGNALIHTHERVTLRFAFNYADYFAGFSDIDVALLTKWSKVCSKWNYWMYNTRTSYSFFYFDNFTNMQREYQILKQFGAIVTSDEGYKGSNSFTNFNNLRYYLISKLTENVDCDYDYEIKHYFDNYFGVASGAMLKVFDKQNNISQFMHDNWKDIFEEGFRNVPTNSTSVAVYNSIGNVNIGTYSSWAFHYYSSNATHGNRQLMSLVYSREDFRELYSYIDEAKALVNGSSLTKDQKARLISRIELEEIGVLYQFLFIYSDRFTVENVSFKSRLTAEDLSAIGVANEVEARNKFADLCTKFTIKSINYLKLDELKSIWESN